MVLTYGDLGRLRLDLKGLAVFRVKVHERSCFGHEAQSLLGGIWRAMRTDMAPLHKEWCVRCWLFGFPGKPQYLSCLTRDAGSMDEGAEACHSRALKPPWEAKSSREVVESSQRSSGLLLRSLIYVTRTGICVYIYICIYFFNNIFIWST